MGDTQIVALNFEPNSTIIGTFYELIEERNDHEKPKHMLVVGLFAGGAAFAASETNMSSSTPHPSVIATNQKAKGNAVYITYAFLPTDGTLNIYAVDSSRKIGATPLGKITLKAGDHREITVALNSVPKERMRLRAGLQKSGQPFKDSGDAPERTFKVL